MINPVFIHSPLLYTCLNTGKTTLLLSMAVVQMLFMDTMATQNHLTLPPTLRGFLYYSTVTPILLYHAASSIKIKNIAIVLLVGTFTLQLFIVINNSLKSPPPSDSSLEELPLQTSTPPFLQKISSLDKGVIPFDKATLDAVTQKLAKHRLSLLIQGEKGIGKTSTAQLIAHALSQQEKSVYQFFPGHLIDLNVSNMTSNIQLFCDFFKENVSCILLIDDLEALFSNEVLNAYAPTFIPHLVKLIEDKKIQFIGITTLQDNKRFPMVPIYEVPKPTPQQIALLLKNYTQSHYPSIQFHPEALLQIANLKFTSLPIQKNTPSDDPLTLATNTSPSPSLNLAHFFKTVDDIILKCGNTELIDLTNIKEFSSSYHEDIL
ncbi:ATP-binding protein [Rhabdochlamydiaceae symbiont of Dictyostelium giganteum]|uniref:ATP-binding protein n=1 Tax=Rhabdochlamydiaceae symbiont of Dictyostelium giganteum TaxID=3342349 RepID=UPI00384CEA8B